MTVVAVVCLYKATAPQLLAHTPDARAADCFGADLHKLCGCFALPVLFMMLLKSSLGVLLLPPIPQTQMHVNATPEGLI